MIIVAQRKLIRQPRLGSGLSLGLCASFIAAWSRLARTWPSLRSAERIFLRPVLVVIGPNTPDPTCILGL